MNDENKTPVATSSLKETATLLRRALAAAGRDDKSILHKVVFMVERTAPTLHVVVVKVGDADSLPAADSTNGKAIVDAVNKIVSEQCGGVTATVEFATGAGDEEEDDATAE